MSGGAPIAKEVVKKILEVLNDYYPNPQIPLGHRDPYTLLVATVLSAQCTDKRVNQVTPKLFARARSPDQMISLDVSEILEIIKPCGLGPFKSKAIFGLSNAILEEHGGEVPDTFEALEALPGVGHKTASVVMCQAFGVPAFPVDTHIHRLAGRWGLCRGGRVEDTERDLKRAFPRDSWGRVHLQMIYFGREYCPARGHDLRGCPICSWAATKKRIEQEQSDYCKYASAKLMVNLLPVIDDFERALDSKPAEVDDQPWIEGLVLIYRKLKSLLEAEGVSEIQALGQDFDPALHEAIMQAPGEEGKVVQEIQKGYKIDDRVIRPAMVVVGNGHEAGSEN